MTKKSAPFGEASFSKAPLVQPVGASSDQLRAVRAFNGAASRLNQAALGASKPAQRSRCAIKKAHVRFDDYLDLNEENMRRSCKKIMNKLYCEPGKGGAQKSATTTPTTTDALSAAGSNVCRPTTPPLSVTQQRRLQEAMAGAVALKSANQTGAGSFHPKERAATSGATIAVDWFGEHKSAALAPEQAAKSCPLQPEEKSYLRSQYERRQKRQLELMNKMQRTKQAQLDGDDDSRMVTNFNLVKGNGSGLAKLNQDDNGQARDDDGANDGANNNICRKQQQQLLQQQQQDSVAKSHELSKRRFFEKLERRESMRKNLEILGTQSGRAQAFRGTLVEHQHCQQLGQRPALASTSAPSNIGGTESAEVAKHANADEKQILQAERCTNLSEKLAPINGCGQQEDGHLMLKLQSVTTRVPAQERKSSILNSNEVDATVVLEFERHREQAKAGDTHDELSGPPARLAHTQPPSLSFLPARPTEDTAGLANELIGFHTQQPPPGRQTGAVGVVCDKASATAEDNGCRGVAGASDGCDQQLELIEFPPAGRGSPTTGGYDGCEFEPFQGATRGGANPLALDQSAFEIRVPPSPSDGLEGNQYDQPADCLAKGFLVVKQVDACGSINAGDKERASVAKWSSGQRENKTPADTLVRPSSQLEECNKTEPIDAPSSKAGASKAPVALADGQMASEGESRQLKRKAAGSSSEESADKSDVTRQLQEVIKAQSSDNQYQLPDCARAELIIRAAISAQQVNQGFDGSERQYHGADEMKRAAPATTSKWAAGKNNGTTILLEVGSASKRPQLAPSAGNKVACKSANHEGPEIKATQLASADGAGGKNNDHERPPIDISNEPIALLAPGPAPSSDAQAKQQVDEKSPSSAVRAPPAALANTSERRTDAAHDGRGARVGGGREGGSKSGLVAPADAEVGADEEAAGLETIITNRAVAGARDVLAEANAKMLNRQIEPGVSAVARGAAQLPPPLDDSVGDEAAKKVALQVEAANNFAGHDHARALELKEIENDEQCGGFSGGFSGGDGGDLSQQRRHFGQREPSPAGRRERPLPEDGQQQQQYANPSFNHPVGQDFKCNPGQHHDQRTAECGNGPSKPVGECENVHLALKLRCDRDSDGGGSGDRLIEPLYCKPGKSLRASRYSGPIEEDIRSSCSSSGFGASVSATSSSSSTESNSSSASSPHHHHHHHHHYVSFREKKGADLGKPLPSGGDQIYDVVRPAVGGGGGAPAVHYAHIARDSTSSEDDHQMARCVGESFQRPPTSPDQAYSGRRGRPLLIENHGYASLVSRCQLEIGGGSEFEPLESFPTSGGHYANLPNDRLASLQRAGESSSIVEYATVRAPMQRSDGDNGNLPKRLPPAENKRPLKSLSVGANDHDNQRRASSGSSETDCDSSLSRRNDSLSSANSGGFSKLPPVRLIDHTSANNVDPAPTSASFASVGESKSQQLSRKPASLFKRFGSLVSRAFTSNDGEPASPVVKSISPVPGGQSGAEVTKPKTPRSVEKTANEGPAGTANNGPACDATTMARADGCGQFTVSTKSVDSSDLRARPTEADLVILPTKQIAGAQKQPVGRKASNGRRADEELLRAGSLRNQRHLSYQIRESRHLDEGYRAPRARLDSSRHRCKSRHRRAHSTSASSGGSSCSDSSSLEYLSLISTPGQRVRLQQLKQPRRPSYTNGKSTPAHLRRASSLSDELASEGQRLAASKRHRQQPAGAVKQGNNKASRSRISIDCVSPTGGFKTLDEPEGTQLGDVYGKANDIGGGGYILKEKSRSLLKWFRNGTHSTYSLASSSPAPRASKFVGPTDYSGAARCDSHRAIKTEHDRDDHAGGHDIYGPTTSRADERHHHSMQFGLFSLIERSHANADYRSAKELCASRAMEAPSSSVHSKVNQDQSKLSPSGSSKLNSNRRCLPAGAKQDELGVDVDGAGQSFESSGAKCQSLSIYQSLMHNYVRKRHHRRHQARAHHGHYSHPHHHRHHNHNHHHHHNHHGHATTNYLHRQQQQSSCRSSSRHAHPSSARCGPQCASPSPAVKAFASLDHCHYSGGKALPAASGANRGDGSGGVWGQLIKINKADGSQVVELQRAPGHSWGFFVARGAINNTKGIFISRMHHGPKGGSLAGLLSVGDRILSIDNCSLEPDFDILRVNQLISKRSKIVLRVKPFKG